MPQADMTWDKNEQNMCNMYLVNLCKDYQQVGANRLATPAAGTGLTRLMCTE